MNASQEIKQTPPKRSLTEYKHLVIVPLQFKVYETSVGEVTEEMPDWSRQAQTHLLQALKNRFSFHGFSRVSELSVEQFSVEQTEILLEMQALFDVVAPSIQQHVKNYGESHFIGRSISDYTLGDDLAKLQEDADAYVLLHGFDQISSGGRKAKQVVTTLLLAILGVATVPQGGVTTGVLGVVDAKTGAVLWLNSLARRGGYDIRTEEGARALIQHLLETW